MDNHDITSSALDKGIELAKTFLEKIIIPPIEEVGLLIRDPMTFWRFKNQVRILDKARLYCEKHNINPNTISFKILCPLLDYSALEESEELQDKWAILLGNMVDSEQNIQNHVFPYILSQISANEFSVLELFFQEKVTRVEELTQEYIQFKADLPEKIKKLQAEIDSLNEQILKMRAEGMNSTLSGRSKEFLELVTKPHKLESEIRSLNNKEIRMKHAINRHLPINENLLKEFELSNLLRLGLIKYTNYSYASPQTLEIPYNDDREYHDRTDFARVNLEVEIDSEEEYYLTELGDLFIKACREKSPNTKP